VAWVVTLTILGLMALALLFYWAKSVSVLPEQTAGVEGERADIESSLALFESCLPPQEVITRLTSPEDREFLTMQADNDTLKLFLKERKSLLLAAMKDVRTAVSKMVQVHKLFVRYSRDISLLGELGLLGRRTAFLVTYGVLTVAIRIFGPLPLGSATLAVHEVAHGLILVHGRLLAALSPEKMDDVRKVFFPDGTAQRWVHVKP